MLQESTFKSLGYCPSYGYGTPGKHRCDGYSKCPKDNERDNAASFEAVECLDTLRKIREDND